MGRNLIREGVVSAELQILQPAGAKNKFIGQRGLLIMRSSLDTRGHFDLQMEPPAVL